MGSTPWRDSTRAHYAFSNKPVPTIRRVILQPHRRGLSRRLSRPQQVPVSMRQGCESGDWL
jgi:hypothetical protein